MLRNNKLDGRLPFVSSTNGRSPPPEELEGRRPIRVGWLPYGDDLADRRIWV